MKLFGSNSHRTLKRLIGLSAVLDVVAVAIWITAPSTQTHMNLSASIVIAEAAISAVLFGLTYFGLAKQTSWAPFLAMAVPITQRIFGSYVFFPSPAIAVTLVWSMFIVYFAYKSANQPNPQRN